MNRGPLTVRSALWALAAAAALTVAFYYVVGFPANIPTAMGTSVLAAELIESARRHRTSPQRIALTAFHAVLAALASWLGVEIVRLLGGLG